MLNSLRDEGKAPSGNDSGIEQSLNLSDFRVGGNISFDKDSEL